MGFVLTDRHSELCARDRKETRWQMADGRCVNVSSRDSLNQVGMGVGEDEKRQRKKEERGGEGRGF